MRKGKRCAQEHFSSKEIEKVRNQSVDQKGRPLSKRKTEPAMCLKPCEKYVSRRRNDDRFYRFSQTATSWGCSAEILLTHLSPWLSVILLNPTLKPKYYSKVINFIIFYFSDFRIKIKLLFHMAYKPQADPCSFLFLSHPLCSNPFWTS